MKVKFKLEKVEGTNLVKYPDDQSFFSNTIITDDGYVIADYSGNLNLNHPTPIDLLSKEEKKEEKLKETIAKLDFSTLETQDVGKALKAIMIHMGIID